MPSIKSVLKPIAKGALIPFGSAAASATDATIQNKIFGSGITTLIISNEEMNNIMKIVKSLEDASLSMKGISETIQNEAKKTKKVNYSVCY